MGIRWPVRTVESSYYPRDYNVLGGAGTTLTPREFKQVNRIYKNSATSFIKYMG
jgi:hypothetical protein